MKYESAFAHQRAERREQSRQQRAEQKAESRFRTGVRYLHKQNIIQ
jgi:hypothetical protein